MSEQDKRVVILNWLLNEEQAGLRTDYEGGKGFHVSGRTKIQLKGKAPMPITEALRQAGFTDGCEVGGYNMRIKPGEQVGDRVYAETFKFFAVRPPVQIDSGVFD